MKFVYPSTWAVSFTKSLHPKINIIPECILRPEEHHIGVKLCIYNYDYDRQFEGHGIWIPGSSPHRLYPDWVAVISPCLNSNCP